ncbi:MAG: helix-turn-helix domain-containing protein [Deltaproteobacteria bacterium]|nr:helix-turn-helix domain-containing protein [Deltaproteobacteria bacterium]
MASSDTDFVSLPLLTVSETAKYLGVSRKIVYQLLEFGDIRAVKRKGAVLIEKASIETLNLALEIAPENKIARLSRASAYMKLNRYRCL